MITFEIVDTMPTPPRSDGPREKRVIVHGSGAYLSGYIRLPDGRRSPESADPMLPFRWLARHSYAY